MLFALDVQCYSVLNYKSTFFSELKKEEVLTEQRQITFGENGNFFTVVYSKT